MGYRELQRAISILESSSSSSSSSSPFTAEVTSNATRHLKASLVGMTEELAENLLEYDLAKMQAGVAAISAICVFSIYNFFPAFSSSSASGWVLAFEILKVASLASTSFIEEQHQTFYFLLVTSYCLLAFRALRARAQEESPPRRDLLWTLLFVLPMLRVARKWNQTGDKWSHLSDLSDWLLLPGNSRHLLLLHLISLSALLALLSLRRRRRRSRRGTSSPSDLLSWTLQALCLGLTALHNCAEGAFGTEWSVDLMGTRGVREAQLIYLLCLLNLLTGLFTSNGGPGGLAGAGARARAPAPSAIAAESILQSLLPVLAVLNPPQNTALFPLLLMAGQNLDSLLRAAGAESAWLYGTLGFAFYFYQGNSNSLSTVDVGASFTGVSSYSPAPVTAITFANTYGAVVAAVLLFLAGGGPGVGDGDGDGDGDDGRKRKWKGAADALWSAGAAFLLSRACELLFFLCLITCLRYHLFVWTVFSPKLLYEGTLSIAVAFTFSSVAATSNIHRIVHQAFT